jgi:hypothetical protein
MRTDSLQNETSPTVGRRDLSHARAICKWAPEWIEEILDGGRGHTRACTHKSKRLGSGASDVRYAPESGAKAGIAAGLSRAISGHLSTIHIKLKLALKSLPDRNQLAPRAHFMRIDVSPSLSPTETEGSTECQLP